MTSDIAKGIGEGHKRGRQSHSNGDDDDDDGEAIKHQRVGDGILSSTHLVDRNRIAAPSWSQLSATATSTPATAETIADAKKARAKREANAKQARLFTQATNEKQAKQETDEVKILSAKSNELSEMQEEIGRIENDLADAWCKGDVAAAKDAQLRIDIIRVKYEYNAQHPVIEHGGVCSRQLDTPNEVSCDVPPQYMLQCGHTLCNQCIQAVSGQYVCAVPSCGRSFTGIRLRKRIVSKE